MTNPFYTIGDNPFRDPVAVQAALMAEGKEAKFNEGDKVHIAKSHSFYPTRVESRNAYVHKTNAHGHTIVRFKHDNGEDVKWDYGDKAGKPMERKFDHWGSEIKHAGHVEHPSPGTRIVSHEEGEKIKKDTEDRHERNRDHDEMHSIISGQKNGMGHFHGFTKEHADRLHELIKKHTKDHL